MLLDLVIMLLSVAPSNEVPKTWFEAYLMGGNSQSGYEGQAELASRPTRQQVADALPSNALVSFRVQAICYVENNGRLSDCRPQELWPADQSTFLSALKLVPSLHLGPAGTTFAKSHGGYVRLSMYLDDDRRTLDRSCPPVWCPF